MPELNAELISALALQNKVAVVTGAGSGLGQDTARILALAGARVMLVDVNEAGLEKTAAALGQSNMFNRHVDISLRDQVEMLADTTLSDMGKLDVWVNCAGLPYLHPPSIR